MKRIFLVEIARKETQTKIQRTLMRLAERLVFTKPPIFGFLFVCFFCLFVCLSVCLFVRTNEMSARMKLQNFNLKKLIAGDYRSIPLAMIISVATF